MASVGDVIQGPIASSQNKIVTQLMSLDGDGATFDANVDGSATAQYFEYRAPAGEVVQLTRLLVYVADGGIWSSADYGGVSTLANGITMEVVDGTGVSATEVFSLTDGKSIMNTIDWGIYSYDVQHIQFNSGDDHFLCRWTFSKAGANIRLYDDVALRVTINDDLTGLSEHTFTIQGTIEGTSY